MMIISISLFFSLASTCVSGFQTTQSIKITTAVDTNTNTNTNTRQQSRSRRGIPPNNKYVYGRLSSSSSTTISASISALSALTKKQLEDFCTTTESQAVTASESWVVDATEFLTPEQSSAVSQRLEGRADVASFKVGLYHHQQQQQQDLQQHHRFRYVFANPDLGYDKATAESDYCAVLRIENVSINSCDPWPNIMTSIGIPLENVGDILVVEKEAAVYIAVNPDSVKSCIRLLPKELPGTGVTVTHLDEEEDLAAAMMAIDGGGEVVQDMEIKRLDKRR